MGLTTHGDSSGVGLLMIERFYPIYQSHRAQLILYRETVRNCGVWQGQCIAALPFLHRFAVTSALKWPAIVAATLCGSKESRDDWSSPGALYLIRDDGAGLALLDQPILSGLHQNHGLYVRRRNGVERIYVAAAEGIFVLSASANKTAFEITQILDSPTSDIVVEDIDGDGQDEILTISPFHGNTATLLKQNGQKWDTVWSADIHFGHVLWMGRIGLRQAILLGSRSGRKDLTLHLQSPAGRWRFDSLLLDEGCEPMNARVQQHSSSTQIYVSNGVGEIARYSITGDNVQ